MKTAILSVATAFSTLASVYLLLSKPDSREDDDSPRIAMKAKKVLVYDGYDPKPEESWIRVHYETWKFDDHGCVTNVTADKKSWVLFYDPGRSP